MADSERVTLTVPGRSEYARTVRLASAELAVRCGMDIDEVDDVKLAVEEAFVYACERVGSGELTFAFELGSGRLDLTVGPLSSRCDAEGESEADRYARFILESVCDEFDISEADGACRLHIAKLAGQA